MRLIALCLLAASAALAAPAPSTDLAANVDGPYDVTLTLNARGPAQAVLLDWKDGQGLAVTFDEKATTVREITTQGARTLATGPGLSSGPVRIKRRFPLIEVYGKDSLALRTYSRLPLGGVCAPAKGTALTDFAVQPVDLIQFHDEFFNPEGGESVWEPQTGKWTIGTYRDPLKALENRPIAASWYQCNTDGPALTLTGQDFWDNYRVRAAALASDTVATGLVFYASGKDGYYAFRVRPRPEGQGVAELLQGQTVLATAPVPWRTGNWYELAAEASGDTFTCFVQGHPVLTQVRPARRGGKAGLCAFGHGEARFDDFTVTSIQRVQDQPDWTRDCWERLSGTWGNGKLQGMTRRVTDFVPDTVAAEVALRSGSAGVTLNWQGKSGYELEALAEGRYRLSRVDDGKSTVLATAAVPRAASYSLRLSHQDGRLEAQVGNARSVVYDFTHQGGSAGCCGNGSGAFASFSAALEPRPSAQISAVTGVHTPMPGENSDSRRFMLGYIWEPLGGSWTGTGSDADKRLTARPYGQSPGTLWYFEPCPGDATLAVDKLQLPTGGTAGLALACDKRDIMTGYHAEASATSLKLFRADKLLAQCPLNAVPTTLRLFRDGDHLIAQADAAALTFTDPQPLPGSLCAAYATGSGLSASQVSLGHRRAAYYAFKSEETDWQPVQGQWSTHSGMACIPWDYWYTGRAAPQALAFNEHPQPADLHVDFWVGEYTEGYADGEHKHFPYHDLSLVTSAAKQDLDGGYRFLIGAENGSVTRLLRLGQVVAETRSPAFAITMGSHCNDPREIHVVAHQQAGHLTLDLDGKRALDFTDPQPLPGGYLGLGVTGCNANFRDLWLAQLQ